MEVQKKRKRSKKKQVDYLNLGQSLRQKDVIGLIHGMLDYVDWITVKIVHDPKHIDRIDLDKFLRACIRRNYMHIILWAMTMKPNYKWNEQAFVFGIKYNRLEILKWLNEQKCPWDEKTCDKAAYRGHLDIIRWALEDQKFKCSTLWCRIAAEQGKIHIVQWAHEKGYIDPTNTYYLCTWIATGGNLELLKWACATGYPLNRTVCRNAAQFGRLEILKWAIEQGCHWHHIITPRLHEFAAKFGHPHIVQWLQENNIY